MRFTALEAFLHLFDSLVERKGLDAALSAILATRWQDTEQPRARRVKNCQGPDAFRCVATSSNGQGLRETLRHADVVKPVLNPTEGESPSCSANSTPLRKAA